MDDVCKENALREMTDEERAALRKSMIKMRNALNDAKLIADSENIFLKLKDTEAFAKARTIASYVSFKGEVSTRSLNEHILEDENRRLTLPVVRPTEPGIMDFYHVKGLADLTLNKYQILEPKPQQCVLVEPQEFDLVVVPLVAFSPKGVRLGMGGGYYDRMLTKLRKDCHIVGIAHDFQCHDLLTPQPWDMPLHEVVTPENYYRF